MKLFDDSVYGERCADVYDEWFGSYEDSSIDVLEELARKGRALELGIGTGLIALPLAARGVDVEGIDYSPAMISRLRAKPSGDAIKVTVGDFADVGVDGEFSLIFILFNTFFALQSQEEQVRCFRNVAEHLTADGVFVLEAFSPGATIYNGKQDIKVTAVTSDRVSLKASQHDPVRQKLKSQHIVLINNEVRLYPVEIRYAWPSEIDLMANLAGLRLRSRWSNWKREEFTSSSEKHISIYERVG